MRAPRKLLAITASVLFAACGGGSSDKGGGDGGGGTTPFVPQITGVTLDKSTINVSANEKVTATVSLVAGASATGVTYSLRGQGAAGTCRVDGVAATPGSNAFQLGTNAFFCDGTWLLSQLWVTTATNRYKLYRAGSDSTYTIESYDLAGSVITVASTASTIPVRTFTITGATADTTGPAFSSVVVSGTGTGTAGAFRVGDTVTVDVTVDDAESGLNAGFLSASLAPMSAHSANKYPSQGTVSTDFALVSGSTYRVQFVIGSAMDVYPVDLWVGLQARDVAGNNTWLEYSDADPAKYYDASAGAFTAVDIATVNFACTWPPATVANGSTPLTPGTSGSPGANTFTIASEATVVHSYTVASGTPYNFSLATSGGSAQAVVGLYYADGSVVTNGTLAGTRDRIVGNGVTGVTPTQSTTLYVLTRCNSGDGCTGGSVTHYLATP